MGSRINEKIDFFNEYDENTKKSLPPGLHRSKSPGGVPKNPISKSLINYMRFKQDPYMRGQQFLQESNSKISFHSSTVRIGSADPNRSETRFLTEESSLFFPENPEKEKGSFHSPKVCSDSKKRLNLSLNKFQSESKRGKSNSMLNLKNKSPRFQKLERNASMQVHKNQRCSIAAKTSLKKENVIISSREKRPRLKKAPSTGRSILEYSRRNRSEINPMSQTGRNLFSHAKNTLPSNRTDRPRISRQAPIKAGPVQHMKAENQLHYNKKHGVSSYESYFGIEKKEAPLKKSSIAHKIRIIKRSVNKAPKYSRKEFNSPKSKGIVKRSTSRPVMNPGYNSLQKTSRENSQIRRIQKYQKYLYSRKNQKSRDKAYTSQKYAFNNEYGGRLKRPANPGRPGSKGLGLGSRSNTPSTNVLGLQNPPLVRNVKKSFFNSNLRTEKLRSNISEYF